MKRLAVMALLTFAVVGAETEEPATVEQAKAQLKAANDRIAQLELMIKQQQGLAQFFQAGQALCELDKRPKEAKDDHK